MILGSLFGKLIKKVKGKSLPSPTKVEKERISNLREKFKGPSVKLREDMSTSELEWAQNSNHLQDLVLNQDPREFLGWNVISNTMFISDAPYISVELDYLINNPSWESKWQMAIKESSMGNPVSYSGYSQSSANLIHHAFHVAQFEERTKMDASSVDLIFEFGGGYGSMCRLFHNLGFKGTYIILDLPQFSELQKYYLGSLGLEVCENLRGDSYDNGIYCISKIEDLNRLLNSKLVTSQKTLFIATWSLSETPLNVRESVVPLLTGFDNYLVAYQDNFGEVNNLEYFGSFEKINSDINWSAWPIPHLKGNNYLMGY